MMIYSHVIHVIAELYMCIYSLILLSLAPFSFRCVCVCTYGAVTASQSNNLTCMQLSNHR